jgi:hypothetical protein
MATGRKRQVAANRAAQWLSGVLAEVNVDPLRLAVDVLELSPVVLIGPRAVRIRQVALSILEVDDHHDGVRITAKGKES